MFQSIFHLPLASARDLAWEPSGRVLAGSASGQSFLLTLHSRNVEWLPFLGLGPWSPEGDKVLALTQAHQVVVLAWPSLSVLAALPHQAWSWAGNNRLMALAPEGILWSDAPFEHQEAWETGEDPWQLFHSTEERALGIRWRPSLNRTELVSWKPGYALEVATRPDLQTLRFQEWAWAEGNEAWAAIETQPDLLLRAWSHPWGHEQAQVRRERLAHHLIHARTALLWLTPHEVRGWSMASQEHHAYALDSDASVGALAWHPPQHRLAVATREGLEIIEVNPHG